jgi:hypothetical protein
MWRTIELPEDWKPQPLVIRYFHDENTVIYVNGRKVFGVDGFNTDYQYAVITAKDAGALKPGINYLAAHTHQTGGAQGVDFGLWTIKPDMLPSQSTTSPTNLADADIPFSLKNNPVPDANAKRYWPISYLNLTNSRSDRNGAFAAQQTSTLNWINIQEAPTMLSPYNAGAAKSGIMVMFDPNLAENGMTHQDVQLTREELDKLAAWLDMLVPAFGDYFEGNAWDDNDKRKFAYYERKKQDMHELDAGNILELVSWQNDGKLPTLPKDPNTYRNMAVTPKTVNDLGWQFDFGKPIKTDQVVVTFRTDFSQDTFLKECTIECSNGFVKKIALQKTTDRQVFTFPVQSNVTWLKLTNFVPDQQEDWANLAGVEVLGIDDRH